MIYSTAIRTCNLMHHEVAPLTARLHISFFYSPLNKVHYIFQIFFPKYYRGFLECFWIVGRMPLSFLVHGATLISQSLKKIGDSVTVHFPCESNLLPMAMPALEYSAQVQVLNYKLRNHIRNRTFCFVTGREYKRKCELYCSSSTLLLLLFRKQMAVTRCQKSAVGNWVPSWHGAASSSFVFHLLFNIHFYSQITIRITIAVIYKICITETFVIQTSLKKH